MALLLLLSVSVCLTCFSEVTPGWTEFSNVFISWTIVDCWSRIFLQPRFPSVVQPVVKNGKGCHLLQGHRQVLTSFSEATEPIGGYAMEYMPWHLWSMAIAVHTYNCIPSHCPLAGTYFPFRWGTVGGSVGLSSRLHPNTVYLEMFTRLCTNCAWHRVISWCDQSRYH